VKKLFLAVGVFCAFFVGYTATNHTFAYSGRIHNRLTHMGYFDNRWDDDGAEVLRPIYSGEAIRPTVNNAQSFIDFIKYTKLDIDNNGSGDARDKTGAAFIIHTMIGTPDGQRYRMPTAGQISEWERRVRFADSNGWVSWRTNYSFSVNSYWQGTQSNGNYNDDAFYSDSGTSPTIVFRNASGTIVYSLRWACGNPVGTTSLGPLQDDRDWNMAGRSTVSNASPAPGQNITFNHFVRNTGPQATTPDDVWSATVAFPSGATIRGGHNTGEYGVNEEKLVDTQNYIVPIGTPAGTKICQQVAFDWTNSHGGRNGLGAPACATVVADFDLTPIITATVNGVAPPGSMVEQGETVSFNYAVSNGAAGNSQNANCNIYGRTVPGSYTAPTPSDNVSVGYAPPPTNCPRSFPSGATTPIMGSPENVVAAANTTICRSLFINPATQTGGSRDTEVCIRVVTRPYLKVYGGDIASGGGIETAPDACADNANGAIVSWNKRNGGGYAGAGVQYAAFALDSISDFASAQGAGASAAAPSALSFGNTATNVTSGNFGGSFGSAPCIPDYYGQKPAGAGPLLPVVGVSPLGSGSYARTGSTVIAGGNVNPGNRMTLYIDGDVLITGNITYPGNWSTSQIPLFQLVVKGNIYIASTVTQLDGLYIAQPDGATGGTIYTCALGAVLMPLGGPIYSACNNKLTVNGAFSAKNIEFLRTHGTLSQSAAGEPNSSNNIAEVFNFSPALWIPQPAPGTGSADAYDAITSLPPIL
jgi:hypothetical protein